MFYSGMTNKGGFMKKVLALCLVAIWMFSTGFTWTVTMDNSMAVEVRDAFCQQYNYQETVGEPPVPNPESKTDFAMRHIKTYIREIHKAYKANTAANTARDAAIAASDTATAGITVN